MSAVRCSASVRSLRAEAMRVASEAMRDRSAALLVQVVHLLAEALGVGVKHLVVADDLKRAVAGRGCAEGGGDFAAELGFLVAELAEEKGFLVAGNCPHDDFDLGAGAGHGEGGIAEGDFELFAGDERLLARRRSRVRPRWPP